MSIRHLHLLELRRLLSFLAVTFWGFAAKIRMPVPSEVVKKDSGFPRRAGATISPPITAQLEGISTGIELTKVLPALEKLLEMHQTLLERVELISRQMEALPKISSETSDLGEKVWLDEKKAMHRISMTKNTFEKHVYGSSIKIRKHLVGGKNYFHKDDLDLFMRTWEDKSNGYA